MSSQVSLKSNFGSQNGIPKVVFDVVSDMKRCSKCGELKTKTDFPKDTKMISGLSSWCKECLKNYQREWYKDNKDDVKDYVKDYNLKNQEKVRRYQREYKFMYVGKIKHMIGILNAIEKSKILWGGKDEY